MNFWPIDTKQAKEGILHLQEFQHIDHTRFHPFRVDPRTYADVEKHDCKICGWRHRGRHLKGRPRAYYVVADGQGELRINNLGKLEAVLARDEWGMARTRMEYPRHRPRETADGEEKGAAKIYDDFVDADKALMGYVFHMIKRLTPEEALRLRYREIDEELQGMVYSDAAAREAALTSMPLRYAEEREKLEQEGKSWLQQLDGREDA